ncbi:MAG: sulfotransferase, partial [Spirulina sp.]
MLYTAKLRGRLRNAARNLERPRSILFYTSHKCASTFVGKLLDTICKKSQYEIIDYAGTIWGAGDRLKHIESPYELFLERAYSDLYSLHGKIYAPQREYLDFPGRTKFKHIFFLRDPRDVLISAYYSFGFTHLEPSR